MCARRLPSAVCAAVGAEQQLLSVGVTNLVLPDSTRVTSSACVCLRKGLAHTCNVREPGWGIMLLLRIFCFCLVLWAVGEALFGLWLLQHGDLQGSRCR